MQGNENIKTFDRPSKKDHRAGLAGTELEERGSGFAIHWHDVVPMGQR
jgi:hypothetical protein